MSSKITVDNIDNNKLFIIVKTQWKKNDIRNGFTIYCKQIVLWCRGAHMSAEVSTYCSDLNDLLANEWFHDYRQESMKS